MNAHRLHLAILRGAALLAPGEQRQEWLAEWTAELWYVGQASTGKRATTFCLGAFRDAFWLRRNSPATGTGAGLRLESPLQCLALLATLAAASALLAFQLPGPREAILPSPYPGAGSLAMISAGKSAGAPSPTISLDRYRWLSDRGGKFFTDLAYYRPISSGGLTIAMASANLFTMLQVPIPTNATLILSDRAWRTHFHSDPHIVGRAVRLAEQEAVVGAVIPDGSWRLPGPIDGWLLVDERRLAATPCLRGFVLARLRSPHTGRWYVSVPNDGGGSEGFACASLDTGLPIVVVLLMIAFACVILPATTSLSLGEYPSARRRWWIFLAMKIALAMPIVFFATLDLAPILIAGEVRPHTMLFGFTLAFRWILIDQRRRCPVCLHLLSHPTRIGGLSHVFLDWCGTEFMCVRGHGLLHVPEVATSSYGSQRWLPLDPSWSSLFS